MFQRKYLSMNMLCQKLGGRSRSSIYRDIEKGNISWPVKIGSRRYWVEEEIDDLLAARREDGADQ